MKTVKDLSKTILGVGAAYALAMAALLPISAKAADETKPMKPMKGAEHLLMLNKVETKKDLDALKTDDTIAMVCAKCKTVWISRVKQGVKGAQILNEGGQVTAAPFLQKALRSSRIPSGRQQKFYCRPVEIHCSV